MDDAGTRPVLPDNPQPPAAAYYSLVDALEALERDHRCREAPYEVRLSFYDVRDHQTVAVVTRRFTCLRREMERRGCITVGVQVHPPRLECPDTIEGLGP